MTKIKPADLKAVAGNLRRWRSIRFPGDAFFIEDLTDAARLLEEAAEALEQSSTLPQGERQT